MSRSREQSFSDVQDAILRQSWGRFFGQLLRVMREEAGLPVEVVAPRAAMTVQQWLAIEDGVVPEPEKLLAIADAIEVDHSTMASVIYICAGAWGK